MKNQVLECMNHRVSLRTYDDRPVTDEELQSILEAAMRAPDSRKPDVVFHYCNTESRD